MLIVLAGWGARRARRGRGAPPAPPAPPRRRGEFTFIDAAAVSRLRTYLSIFIFLNISLRAEKRTVPLTIKESMSYGLPRDLRYSVSGPVKLCREF